MWTNSCNLRMVGQHHCRRHEPARRSPHFRTSAIMTRSMRMVRSLLKTVGAPLYVGLCSWKPIKDKLAPHLKQFSGCLYSPRGTGYGPKYSLRRLCRLDAIRGKDTLVVGSQYGAEIPQEWLKYSPRKLVAIDIIPWHQQWRVSADCIRKSDSLERMPCLLDSRTPALTSFTARLSLNTSRTWTDSSQSRLAFSDGAEYSTQISARSGTLGAALMSAR